MNKLLKHIRTRSIRSIIITSCITIILILAIANVFSTFTYFQITMREAVNVQTRELSTQIVYNYENYINSIIKTSNIVQADIDNFGIDSEAGAIEFSNYLGDIVHQNEDILKIAVYDYYNGLCLASSDTGEIMEVYGGEDETWFTEAVMDPTVHVFSIPYSEAETGNYKVNMSKRIKLQNSDFLGVLNIELSFQNFVDLIKKSKLGENGHITIIDPDYNVVYTSLASGAGADEISVIRGVTLGEENVYVDGYNMALNVDTLANTKWRICVFINNDKITEIQNAFLLTLIIISILIAGIGILLYLFVAQMITNPMKQLELAMLKVEKSDYFRMEEVDLDASKEVKAMIRQFNKMMVKIKGLMERVIEEQGAQRKSELKALQNQINPHFLYNTLDSIMWLVENNKNKEAGEMVVALSRLFRSSISKDNEVVPLSDEIEHVRNYLLIQNFRYEGSFDYEFDISEDALTCLTLKLVLQPIVENSIYHGLKNKIEKDKGKISISARVSDSVLILTVADNGYGMRQEAIDELYRYFESGEDTDNLGLKNIYQRIMIYYGGKAEMKIESELDEGTTITIKEPVDRI